MKKSIVSVILAGLMVAGTVGFASSAAEIVLPGDDFSNEPAKGIAFAADSGIVASSYVGYVGGIEPGTTVSALLSALENKNGVTVVRETALGDGEVVKSGDKLTLATDNGNVISLPVIFMGDTERDSDIDLSDVTAMLKAIAGWSIDVDTVAADVNGDGVVNLSDVTLMLKKIAKWNVDFVKTPTLPGQYEMAHKNETRLYKDSNSPMNPVCLSDGIHYDLAVKFPVAADEFATKIIAHCPSFADNEGSLTFSVYKWMGDYDTTVAGMPIVTKDFVNFKDNDYLTFDMTDPSGKGLVEGEYMWRIHNGYDDPSKAATGVGIYYYSQQAPDESTGIKTFLNCKEFNIGPKASIIYATAK